MGRYSYFVATFSILPLTVIVGVLILFFSSRPAPAPTEAEGLEKDIQLYAEIRQRLLEHYDGELTEDQLRNAALEGLAHGTGDQYTRVLPPVKAQSQDLDLGGRFYGIGSVIRHNEDGSIRLLEPQPGGGAAKAGLLADDVVIAVDGVSILGQPDENSLNRIKSAEEGTVVHLSILRGGDPERGDDPKATRLEFDVTRSRVESYSVHDVHLEERDGHRFGYMQISDINANTYDPQFKEAVAELQTGGAEALIIDLRGNGGGRVNVAVALVDGLIAEEGAMVVFTHSSRESNRGSDGEYRTRDAVAITDLPIVILVDNDTASASEIITGALKDHGRAYVIGERTHGKGLVQTIYKLDTDPNYSLNITTTQYFTPLGRRVQNGKQGEPGGILPDLVIPYREGEETKLHWRLRVRQARYNREEAAANSNWWNFEDRMLEAALDVLTGKPVTVKD
ncbi:MAG: PDZ domain-containing protein [Planctomycetes bacterium]|nr:PDZ domain-containing protein [Planctomycetota bacterium]